MELAARGSTQSDLARQIGIDPAHFSAAICAKRPTYTLWRYRLRIEGELGKCLGTSEADAAEIAALGKRIKVDIATAPIGAIRAALRAKCGGGLPTESAGGFALIIAALRWMNAESSAAAKLLSYEN